mgnify:CR=1 FL=1
MRCAQIDYPVFANDMQVIAVARNLGETVIAKPAAMQ